MAKRPNITQQKVEIIDPDLQDVLGADTLKRKDIIVAFGEYLDAEGLRNPDNGNEFYPDATLKDLSKEIGVKPTKVMKRASLLKLTGRAAMEAGLVDY